MAVCQDGEISEDDEGRAKFQKGRKKLLTLVNALICACVISFFFSEGRFVSFDVSVHGS